MPLRNQYVQSRIGARMQSRGEQVLLRTISLFAGSEPFQNPPEITDDLTVVAASTDASRVFIGLHATSVIGRLVPGDIIRIGATFLTVLPMPADVVTDADGIPQLDSDLHPIFGSPPVVNTDTLGWAHRFPVVCVSGILDPTPLVNQAVSALTFVNDQVGYGNPLTLEKMTAMGWVEVDRIGYAIAAFGLTRPPKVNDLLILSQSGGRKCAITQVSPRFSNGIDFLYNVQAA